MGQDLTRATFLRRAAAGGTLLGAGSLSAFLQACGDSSSPTGGASGSPARSALEGPADAVYADLYPTLPRGGRLTIGQAEQIPTTLNVLVSADGPTYWSGDGVHDFLEAYDAAGNLKPSLAEEVEQVSARRLRYRLRDDVYFHNGRKLEARDVKETLDFVADPDSGSGFADRVAGITVNVQDPRTVVIVLERPNADQRALLAGLPIIPIETIDQQATEPVGCGPYAFKRWVKDAFLELEPFDRYWNPDAPRLDALRINHYARSSAGTQAFESGEIDAILPVQPAKAPTFIEQGKDGSVKTASVTPGVVHLGINVEDPDFQDARVRQAIRFAVDREAMATAPFNGTSRPLWFLGIKPENQYYPADLEYGREVDRARALMQEAGVSGIRTKLLTLDVDYFQGVATIAKSNLAEIGIEVELDVVDVATGISRLLDDKDFSVAVFGVGMDPAPSVRLDRYVHSEGSGNYFHYASGEADRLLDRARTATDVGARKRLYRQAFETVFLHDVPVVPVAGEALLGVCRPSTNLDQYLPEPADRWHYPVMSTSA